MPAPLMQHDATTGAATLGVAVEWDGSANDGDWSNGANWSGGVAPAQMDNVYLGTTSQNITAGLDQSSITLEALYIGDQWTGEMSTLQINANNLVIDKRFGAIAITGNFNTVWILNTPPGDDAITLNGAAFNIYILQSRGEIVLGNGMIVLSIICTSSTSRAQVTMGTGAVALSNLFAYGRTRFTMSSNAVTLKADDRADVILDGTADITTLEVWGNSVCRYQTSADLSGSIYQNGRILYRDNDNSDANVGAFTMYGGTVDFRTGTHVVDH